MSASSAVVPPGRFRAPIGARPLMGGAVAAASVGLGLLGYDVLVDERHQHPHEAMAQVAVAWTFVATGLVGWWRRPASRVGPLLAAAGVALLLRRLQYSDQSDLFTLGFSLGELSNALIAHAILGYPNGRLDSRFERRLIALGYFLVVAFPVATLMVYDSTTSCLFDCERPERAESLLLVHGDQRLVDVLGQAYRVAVFGVLGFVLVGLVVRKLVRATPAARRVLAPLLVAGAVAGLRAVFEGAVTFTEYSDETRQILFWWQMSAQAILPLALLVGLLRARLAHATLAQALPSLDGTPPDELRGVLARALGDPSLELAFWLPERQAYVRPGGTPFELPDESSRRCVTRVGHDDEPTAVLVHDPALSEDPGLVEQAAAAAHMALENARLHAELRAQLESVRESRARIVAAADTERRRIERDLHDGAQQRLLALALELRTAQRRAREGSDADLEGLLGAAVDELQDAVRELRELAHGLHPTVLAEQGLEAALAALVGRLRLPVSLAVADGERLPAPLEAAAYFVACESLTNVVKHAGASRAAVTVTRTDGRLVVDVADDGVGGADPHGDGLRGLADRVEALGGRLRVESRPGDGTRIVAELPCAS